MKFGLVVEIISLNLAEIKILQIKFKIEINGNTNK